jgi:hypothetical protein
MSASTATPQRLGRYQMVSQLGAGGMGAVYLARDEELGRDVAIKVLRPLAAFGAPTPDLVERFRREARAIAAVSHPAVVQLYDQGVEGTLPYLVLELVQGPTLAARIRDEGPLSVREIRTLGIQVASALAAAHARNIVHRDVKPSNILQAAHDSWKLADFGIAQMADSSLTITGQFLGTVSFAAPETIGGGAASAASDIYSLAAMLHAALVGEPPYGGLDMARLAGAMAQGPPPPIASKRPDLPASVAAAIDRALALEPGARPTASAFAQELAADGAARAAVASPAAVVVPAAAQTMPTDRVARRRRGIVIAAAAVAAIVLIALATSGGGGGGGAHKAPVPAAAPQRTPEPTPATEVEPGTPPPWFSGLPTELAGAERGYRSEQQKRWRETLEKLHEGDWDKAEEELTKILADDPGSATAKEWLAWLRAAKRDPEAFGVAIEGGD